MFCRWRVILLFFLIYIGRAASENETTILSTYTSEAVEESQEMHSTANTIRTAPILKVLNSSSQVSSAPTYESRTTIEITSTVQDRQIGSTTDDNSLSVETDSMTTSESTQENSSAASLATDNSFRENSTTSTGTTKNPDEGFGTSSLPQLKSTESVVTDNQILEISTKLTGTATKTDTTTQIIEELNEATIASERDKTTYPKLHLKTSRSTRSNRRESSHLSTRTKMLVPEMTTQNSYVTEARSAASSTDPETFSKASNIMTNETFGTAVVENGTIIGERTEMSLGTRSTSDEMIETIAEESTTEADRVNAETSKSTGETEGNMDETSKTTNKTNKKTDTTTKIAEETNEGTAKHESDETSDDGHGSTRDLMREDETTEESNVLAGYTNGTANATNRNTNEPISESSTNDSTGSSDSSSTTETTPVTTTGGTSTQTSTGDTSSESPTGDTSSESSTGDTSSESPTGDTSSDSPTGDTSAGPTTDDLTTEPSVEPTTEITTVNSTTETSVEPTTEITTVNSTSDTTTVEPTTETSTGSSTTDTSTVSTTSTTQTTTTTTPFETLPPNSNAVEIVSGVLGVLLFAGLLATAAVMYRRGKLPWNPRNSNASVRPLPILLSKFETHCNELLETQGRLGSEFQLLQALSVDISDTNTFTAAQLPDNKKKNRYTNILPYDATRVVLDIINDDPSSDYINASFVKGFSNTYEYIASQGPKEETISDFWRMVHQHDVQVIVMVTNWEEGGKPKCDHYLPKLRDQIYSGDMVVRCGTELVFPVYTQRTIVLHKGSLKRNIAHLHFNEWPDFGCPDSTESMLQFCRTLRHQVSLYPPGMVLVHCSAGVGRTGTLIAVDILLQQIQESKKVDVFGTVFKLRKHRTNMVQTKGQYEYIYKCIRDAVKDPTFLKSDGSPASSLEPIYENVPTTLTTFLYEKVPHKVAKSNSSESECEL